MSDPKRHHTVPRVYLEKFTDKDSRLTVWSKRRKNTIRQVAGEALVRGYYYSQPEKGAERANHHIESSFFNKIESLYPRFYSRLKDGNLDIDIDSFVHILAMLRSRSPSFREAFELGLSDLVARFAKTIPRAELPIPPKDMPNILDQIVITIDPHRSIHAMGLYIKNYASILTRFEYSLQLAPRGISLLTSDNPVVWYNNGYGTALPVIYPQDLTNNTRAILPIDKETALIGKPSPTGSFKYKGYAGVLSARQVREINELQVACAWDQVVGVIALPMRSIDRLSRLAPKIDIGHFNADSGEFYILDTYLSQIRNKHKFVRD